MNHSRIWTSFTAAVIAAAVFTSLGGAAEGGGAGMTKQDFMPAYDRYLTQNLPSLSPTFDAQSPSDAQILHLTVDALKSIVLASYLQRIDPELGDKIGKDSLAFAARFRIIGEKDLTKARIAVGSLSAAVMPFVGKPIDEARFARASKVSEHASQLAVKTLREWVGNSAIEILRENIPAHVIKKAADLAQDAEAPIIAVPLQSIPDHVTEKAAELAPLVGEPDLNRYLRQYVFDCITWGEEEESKSRKLYLNNFFMQFMAQKKVPADIKEVSDEDLIADLKARTLTPIENSKAFKIHLTSIKIEIMQKIVDTTTFALHGGASGKTP